MLVQENLPSRRVLMVGILPTFNLRLLAHLYKITIHNIHSVVHVSNKALIL